MQRLIGILLIILSCTTTSFAQEIDNAVKKNKTEITTINPLAPAKAAFYSAIIPGLGQAYNKKYWKIPIIYGALGTSIYFYNRNNKNYHRVLDALKLELQGKPHEFENLDVNALERGVKGFKKDRDLALFISIGFYALNILEANVDAHLPDKKLDSDLSLRPNIFINPISNQISYGFNLVIKL